MSQISTKSTCTNQKRFFHTFATLANTQSGPMNWPLTLLSQLEVTRSNPGLQQIGRKNSHWKHLEYLSWAGIEEQISNQALVKFNSCWWTCISISIYKLLCLWHQIFFTFLLLKQKLTIPNQVKPLTYLRTSCSNSLSEAKYQIFEGHVSCSSASCPLKTKEWTYLLGKDIKRSLTSANHWCCNKDSLSNPVWKALHDIRYAASSYIVAHQNHLQSPITRLVWTGVLDLTNQVLKKWLITDFHCVIRKKTQFHIKKILAAELQLNLCN